jgi:hypothetical protein
MKELPLPSASILALAALIMAGSSQAVRATLIDFNNIPVGTPVSLGNPYAGVVDIQARAGVEGFFPFPNYVIKWAEATIENGVAPSGGGNQTPLLAVSWPEPRTIDDNRYRGEISITFADPVNDLSFDGFAYRPAAYSYTAVDAAGATFTDQGRLGPLVSIGDPATDWQHIRLQPPSGFKITGLTLNNGDPKVLDAGIWIDNISFNAAPVPEAEATLLLLGLGSLTLCLGRQLRLCFWR